MGNCHSNPGLARFHRRTSARSSAFLVAPRVPLSLAWKAARGLNFHLGISDAAWQEWARGTTMAVNLAHGRGAGKAGRLDSGSSCRASRSAPPLRVHGADRQGRGDLAREPSVVSRRRRSAGIRLEGGDHPQDGRGDRDERAEIFGPISPEAWVQAIRASRKQTGTSRSGRGPSGIGFSNDIIRDGDGGCLIVL